MALESVPPPGSLLAEKYRVVRVLGQGGMGVVLEATHEMLATAVAVKVMSAQALEQENAIPRFLREARAAAGLRSEYVARVTDFGTLGDGRPFMVMELLDGEDLSAIMKGEGLSRIEWIDAFLQACAGLAEAHVAGIVHRDLKLANFFRTRRPDGSYCTKILDFGISKLAKTDGLHDATTKSSVLLGTPYYMSPEHVRSSRDVDARSDIWQMGVVLYQAMTGYLPFDGDNVGMLFARILEVAPRPASGLAPDLPEPIERTITACLEKEPERRPPTIAQVAAWLEPFAGPEGRLAAQRARAMQATPLGAAPREAPSMPSMTGAPSGSSLRASAAVRSEWTDAPVSTSIGKTSSSRSVAAVIIGCVIAGAGALGLYVYSRSSPSPGPASGNAAPDGAPPTALPAGPSPEVVPTPGPSTLAEPTAAPGGVADASSAGQPAVSTSAPKVTSAAPAVTPPPVRPRATPLAAPPPKPPTPERPTLH